MAGLIGLQASDIEIQDATGATRWEYEDWIPHPVVRLTTSMPVAVEPQGADGPRTVVKARWGFPVGPRPVGNARDDKLRTSSLWSPLVAAPAGRGLAVTTGVYEMADLGDGAGARAWWFRRVDGRPIVMPALVGTQDLKGEARRVAAIVTTEPNAFFGRFHDRQVCELPDREAMDAWLRAPDLEAACALAKAPAADAWEAVPVGGRIFKPGRVEHEHLVALGPPLRHGQQDPPAPQPKSGQMRLM